MQSFEASGIQLPEEERIDMPSLCYAYGAAHTAAKYCGYEQPPYLPRGTWQHGWIRECVKLHPAFVIWDDGRASTEEHHWVNRKDVEDYLRQHGYNNAHAIGLAIQYLPPIDVPRLKDSLLVMPIHSLYTTEHKWNFDQYLAHIESVEKDFETIAVCVHPACIKKGYWIDAFKSRGYEIIQGALFPGKHALLRMKWLMQRFEYVSSNSIGTQIAYAAAFGAKVSLSGPYVESTRDEIKNTELFAKYPQFIDWTIEVNSEAFTREHYGMLFAEHPKEAKVITDWGQYQIGCDSKRSPQELSSLLGWPKVDASWSISEHPYEVKSKSETQNGIATSNQYAILDLAHQESDTHCLSVGLALLNGYWHGYKNASEAFGWFRRAAQLGNYEAILYVISMLLEGMGTTQNIPEAKIWLERIPKNDPYLEIRSQIETLIS